MKQHVEFCRASVEVDPEELAEHMADSYETDDGAAEEYESDDSIERALSSWVGDALADREFPAFSLDRHDRAELVEAVRAHLVKLREERS